MAVRKKYNALGRGLDALISTDDIHPQGSSTINEVAIDLIDANPDQPRRDFDQQGLEELASSIKELGIIQPITLREMEGGRFQIIAGERRWRASQLIGMKAIPAYIRTISDETVMELALVENIQREDLNAIEIALAYQHLLDTEGMTQDKVSERVGKSRAAITICVSYACQHRYSWLCRRKKSIWDMPERFSLSIPLLHRLRCSRRF